MYSNDFFSNCVMCGVSGHTILAAWQPFSTPLPLQYGEEYWNEVESLWSALCTWPSNIRVTLNYLARLTCVSGTNPTFMLQQVKKIVVCFSKVEPARVVSELIRDLQVHAQGSIFLSSPPSPILPSTISVKHLLFSLSSLPSTFTLSCPPSSSSLSSPPSAMQFLFPSFHHIAIILLCKTSYCYVRHHIQ